MEDQREMRWTVDCWSTGCGWSRTGWDTEALVAALKAHQEVKHPVPDEEE